VSALGKLLKRAWPGLWPAVQFFGQILDIDFLERLDLLKGYQGTLPHLVAFVGFVVCLIGFSLYIVDHPAHHDRIRRIRRIRKIVYWAVPIAFVLSFNLMFIDLPDTAFWSELSGYRLKATFATYVVFFSGFGLLLASRRIGEILRR
jgi:hypothetical protein